AHCQRLYPDKAVVYIDTEGTYDPVWSAKLGIDNDRLLLVNPSHAEQAIDLSVAFAQAAETSMIVMDSLAALVPIAQPRPNFAAQAAREGITEGRVLARLAIGADGRVTGVRILESAPRRVFDREVRHAALRWRYQPPGEPREVDVEFVFRAEG
ncbi:MAG: TonB family protein, partial [Burkholderiaceae bacterium]|nr:TonB family protein [Burkholderiaceae bacterium]